MTQLKRNPWNKKKNRVYLWKKNPGMRDNWLWRSCVREREREVWKKSCEREAEGSSRLRELRELWDWRENNVNNTWSYFIYSVCNFINLESVNWEIYLLYSPSKSLQFKGIKNEGLEVVETPPNSSPSFLKKLLNKVIGLLSLPLLYSPSFF